MRVVLPILVGLLFWTGATAAPFIPADDSQVLERLPGEADPQLRELRRLHAALADRPDDLERAVDLAGRYVKLGRAEADPRYYGYAQAALRPWWDQMQAPPPVLLLRATLRQKRHDFDAALADLAQLLRIDPGNAQALLNRSVIFQVRGEFEAALRDCLALARRVHAVVTAGCVGGAASLSGKAEESYRLLLTTLARSPNAPLQERLWVLTLLAEIAVRLGREAEAEKHFRDALALGVRDIYLLGAYADFLLDQDRPAPVQTLLADEIRPDALLLRLVIAERRLNAPQWRQHAEMMQARIEAARLRGDATHLGSEARFTLEVLDKPAEALQLALRNWAVQREPGDARLVLEAALAADDPQAAQPVLDWLVETGLQDLRLRTLAARLDEPAR